MRNRKAVTGTHPYRRSGKPMQKHPGGGKAGLIRSLYDRGSRLEIAMERKIVRLGSAVSLLLCPKGKKPK